MQNSSSILRCKFLARKGAKFIANFSATKVTSLPPVPLCVSLSHRAHLTHNIGSASALPIIISQMVRFCFNNNQHSMRFQHMIRCPVVFTGTRYSFQLPGLDSDSIKSGFASALEIIKPVFSRPREIRVLSQED